MRPMHTVLLIGLLVVPLMSLKQIEPMGEIVPPPPPRSDFMPVQRYSALPEIPPIWPEPALVAAKRKIKVTACSPQDSAIDAAYYAEHGYKGAVYNIAANLDVFPKGTMIRVPGYLAKSHPDKFWEVDSAGGPIIRRSAAKGVTQIDVKFRSREAVVEWGVKWLTVEIVTPAAQAKWEADYAAWDRQAAKVRAVLAERDRIRAEDARRNRGDLGDVPRL